MGQIFHTGGPVEYGGIDCPVASAVTWDDFTTCAHCQRTILFNSDKASGRYQRLQSDYRCPSCGHLPICNQCGDLQNGGAPCPGPAWQPAQPQEQS